MNYSERVSPLVFRSGSYRQDVPDTKDVVQKCRKVVCISPSALDAKSGLNRAYSKDSAGTTPHTAAPVLKTLHYWYRETWLCSGTLTKVQYKGICFSFLMTGLSLPSCKHCATNNQQEAKAGPTNAQSRCCFPPQPPVISVLVQSLPPLPQQLAGHATQQQQYLRSARSFFFKTTSRSCSCSSNFSQSNF